MSRISLEFVSHLRGHVTGPTHYTTLGDPVWTVDVINTHTGRVVETDDAFSLADAISDAAERTYIARAAWFYGFRRKELCP